MVSWFASVTATPQFLVRRSGALYYRCAETFAVRTLPAALLSRGLHSDLVKGAGPHLHSQSESTAFNDVSESGETKELRNKRIKTSTFEAVFVD